MADNADHTDEQTSRTAHSLPHGLTVSMFTIAASLGILLICRNLWPAENLLALIVHGSAVLCLVWGLAAHAFIRLSPSPLTGVRHDVVSAVQVTQLVLGLVVAIVMLYLAITAVLARMFQPHVQIAIWPSGMLDISVVAIAVLLAWWRTGNGVLMTSLMWLLTLMSLWSALQVPAYVIREVHGIPFEVPLDWISPFVLGTAFVVAAFTVLAGIIEHRRRVTAWPDDLDNLVTPAPAWPGFGYSAGIISVIVLVVGCITVVSPLTAIAAFLAGASMLALANRRWNENFADAGMGLITLGVVSLLMLGVPDTSAGLAGYFAAVFSRTLLGLALMTGFWHWLAAVWDQQLDNGRPWTTAGNLIHPCHRVGFILGTAGVLVAFNLAFWPKLPAVYNADDTLRRWIWGLLGHLMLIAALMRSARRTGKPTLAWLALFAAISLAAFVLIRASRTVLYTGFLEFWPVILAIVAGVLILLARLANHSRSWKPFFEPAYATGVLFNPLIAICGASLIHSNAFPRWVESTTFAVLTLDYLLAAFVAGPRRLVILAGVCAAATAVKLAGR
jgi:hypothetical protein